MTILFKKEGDYWSLMDMIEALEDAIEFDHIVDDLQEEGKLILTLEVEKEQ